MDKDDAVTISLIGSIVRNMRLYDYNFINNKIRCPFADNVMERCENENNPTVFCDWEHCPLDD